MSRHDYERSARLATGGDSFTALIMAAMRRADTQNADMLKASWPDEWAELQERYNAPGGFTKAEATAMEAHADDTKPKIFICGAPGGISKFDWTGCALAEDGTGLGEHLCSSLDFVQHDMGVTSDWKHEHYAKHYPDGYCLVWLGAWPEEGEHPAFDAALAINKANWKEDEPV